VLGRPCSAILIRLEAFDIGFGSHICLAAGGQLTDALPISASRGVIPFQPTDVTTLQQSRSGIRRHDERFLDILQGGIETIESAICAGTVNQRVDTIWIRLQHMIQVVDSLVEVSCGCGRLRPVDQQIGIIRQQRYRRTRRRVGSRGVTGEAPSLPGLIKRLGSQCRGRRRHRLRKCFEADRRLLVLLEPDQRDGSAVIGRMCAAALVPRRCELLGGCRVLLGELHAVLVCRCIRRGIPRLSRHSGHQLLRRSRCRSYK
jgi:hypothetical protein